MSLRHALLTALVERSCSGSELAARFERSIGYFWHATHQQIYRELARLEDADLIKSLSTERARGRKRIYRILPAGRKELKRWVTRQGEVPILRDELMVRLWAEAAIGPAGLDREIRRQLSQHEKKLALYRDFEACSFPKDPDGREKALRHLVLQSGIRYESYWIDVLAAALKILGRAEGDPGT